MCVQNLYFSIQFDEFIDEKLLKIEIYYLLKPKGEFELTNNVFCFSIFSFS